MAHKQILAGLRSIKLQARVSAQAGRQRLSGETGSLAKTFGDPSLTPYCWSEFVTPIRDRGAAPELSTNRLHNMDLATGLIDGLVIGPGEVFRFFSLVPRPTEANGFRGGPVLRDGELDTDVGGGLCQISTNLFNAFLLADFTITDRHNHSMDPWGEARFVPLGRDAAVAWGYKDLAAQNPHNATVQLRLRVDRQQRQVVASVWGPDGPAPQVSVTSDVLAKVLGTTPEASPGWEVSTRRISVVQGHLVETYRAVDKYRPFEQAVAR